MATRVGRVKDPSDTSGNLIAASKVNGTTVYDPKGEELGSVEDMMIDKMSGQVNYAILSFGGFLGMGTDYYPLPWRMLTYDTNKGGFVVEVTKQMLDEAPSYVPESSWTDWDSVDAHYGSMGTGTSGRSA